MKIEIVKATAEHAVIVAANCRDEDVAEFWAQSRQSPQSVIDNGLRVSMVAFTALVDDEPVCIYGVAPYSILAGQGIPWMVSTKSLKTKRLQRAVLRESLEAIDYFKHLFPTLLFNMVHDENTSAKRWLNWLGFKLLEPVPIGQDGALFRPFYWSGSHV